MLFKTFEDCSVWKEARRLVQACYSLTELPRFKRDFALKEQLQRAAVSCMTNVAEGFDSDTRQQFIQLVSYSKRSASEVQSILYASLDLNYIDRNQFQDAYLQAETVRKLANGLIRYLRKTPTPSRLSRSHVYSLTR